VPLSVRISGLLWRVDRGAGVGEVDQSRLHKGRPVKDWLSQLLADSAFPALVLAIAISQVRIGHQKTDDPRRRDQPASKAAVNAQSRTSTGKFDSASVTESSLDRRENTSAEELVNDR
jgi:hypothetical protein